MIHIVYTCQHFSAEITYMVQPSIQTYKNAKIKVSVSVDKQRTLIRIYMEKYISV